MGKDMGNGDWENSRGWGMEKGDWEEKKW
jgi:hypothetical protein